MAALFGFLTTLILFLIVLVILVVGHELGHFFMAKFFGVNVEEFGLGYPPRAKKLFVWKGTLFTLNWLPFGGFVKIFGEESEDEGSIALSNSFAAQNLSKRILILIGGILANMILAIVLYSTVFMIGFSATPSDFPEAHVVVAPMLTTTEILDNSPAALSGMQVGDQIISATDNSQNAPSEFATPENFISYIQTHGNTDIHVTIMRNKDQKILDIVPKANVVGDKPGIGAGIDMIGTLRLGFLDSIKTGFTQSIQEFKAILAGVGSLVSSIFTGNKKVLSELSGPIGIAKYGGMAAAEGIGSFLAFMAIISINLAVVNLLPFPALDGGRIVLEIFARKGKSKISPRIVNTINQIGFLLLILLMLVVTYHDIIHVL